MSFKSVGVMLALPTLKLIKKKKKSCFGTSSSQSDKVNIQKVGSLLPAHSKDWLHSPKQLVEYEQS